MVGLCALCVGAMAGAAWAADKPAVPDTAAASTRDGRIEATLGGSAKVVKVWAIDRMPMIKVSEQGRRVDEGLGHKRYAGRIEKDRVVFDHLPVPGHFDLVLQTQSGGLIRGWDAHVPQSDYVGDPPLEKDGRTAVLKGEANRQFTAFADVVRVLDIQGNIQNAAVLVAKLRRRPFVGGGYKPGEWVWRIERWQWENPDEQTWVPYQERPYYALTRQRLRERDYQAKRVLFARQLGGLDLSAKQATMDLGTLTLPKPPAGIFAMNPDGTLIQPILLKGSDPWPKKLEPEELPGRDQ